MTSLLSLQQITKAYPGVLANDAVDFAVERGEIHALLGENGAGKSTLMKVLSGLTKPDSGQIIWKDQAATIPSPQASKALGIGMVHQHFALFDGMSVGENIALGLGTQFGATQRDQIIDMSEKYGLPLDPDALVFTLSAGEKQRIEIVRALLGEPELLILDEPTSVLTPQEADSLFSTLRLLRDEGRGLVFISHKLNEVRALCKRATILRGGKVVATCNPAEKTAEEIAEMMIGTRPVPTAKAAQKLGETALDVRDLVTNDLRIPALSVRRGEIVGVAGVAGNGQEALYAYLAGEELAPSADVVRLNGVAAGRFGPSERRSLGSAFVPEERLGHAAVPDFSLIDNTLLSNLGTDGFQSRGLINWQLTREHAVEVCDGYDVRHAGVTGRAGSLSGGNLQKFIVGRELIKRPEVLIVNQPTWGVDMGSAINIRDQLKALAEAGSAVLVISQDLDELFELADTLCVLNHGHLSASQPTSAWTAETLGVAMTGDVNREVAA
ncbi:MAG: ABC transporter ATP-binding protein [Alphaproteobacteria bacterium TMED89]|nr:ABC transporter [Rhodospirillaceae bacterium]RPH10217.1 MAG: ABC transporter ATP-binding protein [Alphaproteobacteria bacterium TMED89]